MRGRLWWRDFIPPQVAFPDADVVAYSTEGSLDRFISWASFCLGRYIAAVLAKKRRLASLGKLANTVNLVKTLIRVVKLAVQEDHHVAVFNDIFLPFGANLSCFARGCPAACG